MTYNRAPNAISVPSYRTNEAPLLLSTYLRDHHFQCNEFDKFVHTRNMRNSALLVKEAALDSHIQALKSLLETKKIPVVDVHGRIKSIYSTYRKLRKYDLDLSRIYDLVAIRIIVDDIDTCYLALAAIHERYQPVSGRTKDYIIKPKVNGYKSLHTSVNSGLGPFEVQIRTRQMHHVAEFGSAAHWLYDLTKDSRFKAPLPPSHATLARLQATLRRQRREGGSKKPRSRTPRARAVRKPLFLAK